MFKTNERKPTLWQVADFRLFPTLQVGVVRFLLFSPPPRLLLSSFSPQHQIKRTDTDPTYPRHLEPQVSQVSSASWRAVFKQLFRTDTDNKCNWHHHIPDSWSPRSAQRPGGPSSNSYLEQIQTTNAKDTTYPQQLELQLVGIVRSKVIFHCFLLFLAVYMVVQCVVWFCKVLHDSPLFCYVLSRLLMIVSRFPRI